MTTRFVNPDADPGGNGTTNATSGANAAYSSLSVAEAALPATLADAWEIICETSGSADTTGVVLTGVTTSATFTLHIYTSSGHRHDGKYNTAKYRLEPTGARAISNGLNNITFTGLQAKTSTGGAFHCFYTQSASTLFDRLIAGGAGGGTGNGFHMDAAGTVRNSIAQNCNNGVSFGASAVAQNVTSVNNAAVGFVRTFGSPSATNCYAGGNPTADYQGGSFTKTTCASSDATGTTGLQNIAVATGSGARFVNVTGGSEDFHIQTGSALIDVGTNLSGTFTLDIDGATRSGTWDIGADEFTSTTNSFSITGAGGLAFAGATAPLRGRALSGSGALAFAGGTIPLRGRSVTAAGALALAGAASVVRGVDVTGAGGVSFAGAAGVVRSQLVAGAGGLTFAGASPLAVGRVQPVAGGVVFSGTGNAVGSGSGSFAITGSGSVMFGGVATVTREQLVAGVGGVQWSGAAAIARGRVQPVAGGLAFSGVATVAFGRSVTASGGLAFDGAATITTSGNASIVGSGGLAWTGSAGLMRGVRLAAPAGALVFSGDGNPRGTVFSTLTQLVVSQEQLRTCTVVEQFTTVTVTERLL